MSKTYLAVTSWGGPLLYAVIDLMIESHDGFTVCLTLHYYYSVFIKPRVTTTRLYRNVWRYQRVNQKP